MTQYEIMTPYELGQTAYGLFWSKEDIQKHLIKYPTREDDFIKGYLYAFEESSERDRRRFEMYGIADGKLRITVDMNLVEEPGYMSGYQQGLTRPYPFKTATSRECKDNYSVL